MRTEKVRVHHVWAHKRVSCSVSRYLLPVCVSLALIAGLAPAAPAAPEAVRRTSGTPTGPNSRPVEAAAAPQSKLSPGTWVALGDSYSSGEGVGNSLFTPGTNAHDRDGYYVIKQHRFGGDDIVAVNTAYPYNECRRSDHTYSRLLDRNNFSARGSAGDLHGEPFDVALHACSGAVVSEILAASQGKTIEIPDKSTWDSSKGPDRHRFTFQGPQATVGALQTANLVSLSVGGNDIGFGDLGKACLMSGLRNNAKNEDDFADTVPSVPFTDGDDKAREVLRDLYRHARTCQTAYQWLKDNGHAGSARDPEVELPKVGASLVKVYERLLSEAPAAQILVVGYPNVVSTAQSTPFSLDKCPLAPVDRPYVAGVVQRLNAAAAGAVSAVNSAQVAAGSSARLTFVDQSRAFDGHELCGKAATVPGGIMYENGLVDVGNGLFSQFWGDGHLSTGKKSQDAAISNSLHPTVFGYRAMAKRVMWAIDKLLGSSPPTGGATTIDTALIVDSSGSMTSNDPADIRLAASETYVRLAIPGDYAGVVQFDSSASIVAPLSPLPQSTDRLISAIRTIDSSGGTNIGRAVAEGCRALEASPSPNARKIAILLTDGVGTYTDQVSCFVNRGWKLFPVGFGEADDGLLSSLAAATGGTYIDLTPSPSVQPARRVAASAAAAGATDGVQSLPCEFQRVRSLAIGEKPAPCVPYQVGPGTPVSVTVPVPDRQVLATFTATWIGGPVGLGLRSPSGRVVDPADVDVTYNVSNNVALYSVREPEPGVWTVDLSGANLAEPQNVVLSTGFVPTLGSPPTAIGSVQPGSGRAPLSITYDSTGSFDPDGPLGYVAWDFGDGSGVKLGNSGAHTYSTPGSYRVQLVVIDGAGESAGAEFTVEVAAPDTVPSCTQNLTGDVIGPFTVGDGEHLCIDSARVVGPVDVAGGGSLTITGSRVARGIHVTGGRFVKLCDTSVATDGLRVTGATGPVVVGDPGNACPGNRILGLTLDGNRAGVTLAGNVIVGNAGVNDNSGGPVIVSQNTVEDGTLACAANNPPPDTKGQPNAASGGMAGQCAASPTGSTSSSTSTTSTSTPPPTSSSTTTTTAPTSISSSTTTTVAVDRDDGRCAAMRQRLSGVSEPFAGQLLAASGCLSG